MDVMILETLAIISAGVMTGSELCVSVFHAELRTMDERAQFEMGQKSAAVFGKFMPLKFMPLWYAATLLLSVAVAYTLRGRSAAAALADISAALWLLSILGTITLLVPINTRITQWIWETRPSDWQQARQTWDTWHRVRVVVLIAALICLASACLIGQA